MPPLCGKAFKESCPFAHIEGKPPEHGIDAVFDDGGKPCMAPVIKQGGQSEVLFNNVSLFGYGLVAGDLGFSQFRIDIVFAHDAVGNLV